MECHWVRDLLEEYFEGTLPRRRHERVASHLTTCETCAAELIQIERMTAALEEAPRVAPSDELLVAISARVAQLPAPGQARTMALGWRRVAVIAAAFVGIFAAGGHIMQMLLVRYEPLLGSTLAWMSDGFAQLGDWTVAAATVLATLWHSSTRICEALWLAGRGSASTLGLYALAEVGILLAIVLVFHLGRRRTLARQMFLV